MTPLYLKPTAGSRYSGVIEEYHEVKAFLLARSEEHTSELQSRSDLVCRLLLEKKKKVRPAAADERRPHPRINQDHNDGWGYSSDPNYRRKAERPPPRERRSQPSQLPHAQHYASDFQ